MLAHDRHDISHTASSRSWAARYGSGVLKAETPASGGCALIPAEEVAHDRKTLERFRREARRHPLNHSNLHHLRHRQSEQRTFIAMELLEGHLKHLISSSAGNRISLTWAFNRRRRLIAAHSKASCHRDIKPANIFVTARGSKVPISTRKAHAQA